jgi:hypothetical protein
MKFKKTCDNCKNKQECWFHHIAFCNEPRYISWEPDSFTTFQKLTLKDKMKLFKKQKSKS